MAHAMAGVGREAARRASAVLRLGAAAYVVQTRLLNSTLAVGPSMEPTLSARGDVLLTARMTPRAGDIVVAVKPTDADTHVVKRLVRRQRCPPHHVWLRGDNAPRSLDSRHYGAVPDALLRGVVVARLWPPRRVCGRRALRTCAAPPKHQRE